MKYLKHIIPILLVSIFAFAQDEFSRSPELLFKLKSVSLTEGGPEKADRIFTAGQTVWINLFVHGCKKDAEKNVNFQADLLMVGKGNRVVLDKKNILDQRIFAGDIIPVITATFNIDLYDSIIAEKYDVHITFRDMVAKTYNVYDTTFVVADK